MTHRSWLVVGLRSVYTTYFPSGDQDCGCLKSDGDWKSTCSVPVPFEGLTRMVSGPLRSLVKTMCSPSGDQSAKKLTLAPLVNRVAPPRSRSMIHRSATAGETRRSARSEE